LNFVDFHYIYLKFYIVNIYIILRALVILFIRFGRRFLFYGCIQVYSFATLCKYSWLSLLEGN
jgi:hypothetical protein